MKYVESFLKYFDKFPIFTTKDVKLFLNKNDAGEDYYKIFMHNLVGSGRAFRIKRGYYTLHNNLMAAGFAFTPFYYGLETALTHYNLWDYMTPVSIITTRRVRSGIRSIFGRNVSIRRISEKMFFGYSMVNYDELFYIPMADMEKTLIDSVYFHSLFNKEVYKKVIGRVDMKKLKRYLNGCPSIVKSRVNKLLEEYRNV